MMSPYLDNPKHSLLALRRGILRSIERHERAIALGHHPHWHRQQIAERTERLATLDAELAHREHAHSPEEPADAPAG